MPVPNLRPLGFGEILDGAFSLYRRNLTTFLLTALLPVAALVVGGAIVAVLTGTGSEAAAGIGAFGLAVLLLLSVMVQWGALVHQASQSFIAQPIDIKEAVRTGVRSMFTLLGSAFVTNVGMSFVMIGGFLVMALAGAVVGALAAPALSIVLGAGMIFGFVFVYVGGAAVLAGAGPAVIVEGKGPVEALSRSVELLRGAFWRTVGLVMVTATIVYLPMIAVAFVSGLTEGVSGAEGGAAEAGAGIVILAVAIAAAPFIASVFVLAYYDRRVRTEALDVQLMTESLALAGG
ncbi:hypothetical protein [Longimicrobium sp.]|uniref:hypothetical protein n=1 Tax=Longimicrobium sp. TaxID=2029185 RepID=UPI002F9546AD